MKLYAPIGAARKSTSSIGTTKRSACITLASSSSAASTGYGVRAGHAADNLGMLKVARMVSTEVKGRTDRLNSASIMVSPIPSLSTLIAIVASLMS